MAGGVGICPREQGQEGRGWLRLLPSPSSKGKHPSTSQHLSLACSAPLQHSQALFTLCPLQPPPPPPCQADSSSSSLAPGTPPCQCQAVTSQLTAPHCPSRNLFVTFPLPNQLLSLPTAPSTSRTHRENARAWKGPDLHIQP